MTGNQRKKWLIKTPGVVFALAMAVKAYTEPGDSVLIQQPVYYPFSEVITGQWTERWSAMICILDDGWNRYHDGFCRILSRRSLQMRIKLFLLCSPHNPVGRVWTKEELDRNGRYLCEAWGNGGQ